MNKIKMDSVEIADAIKTIPHSKLLKFTNLFVDYVDSDNLNELHEMIKIDQKPSDNFYKNLVNDAKQNHKLFQWISVLLRL